MTRTHTDIHALAAELVALHRLTRTEAQIARLRVAQAKDEAFRRELLENAEQADERSLRLQDALRALGGTPDVVGDVVGRAFALTKATTEQLQPFSEGLLGDLALEHQLRDRAVFARVLAEAHDELEVAALMRDLESAHTETIEWIAIRLAELAQGGPVALVPTPPQAAFRALARFAVLPTRQYAALLNKTADLVRRSRAKAHRSADAAQAQVRESAEAAAERARETVQATRQHARDAAESTRESVQDAAESTRKSVQDAAESTRETAGEIADATAEVAEAGRDAAMARAEEVAPSETVREAAHEAREMLGTVESDALPIKDYDALTATDAAARVADLRDSDDVRLVMRYERAHKDRKTVLTAADKRVTDLAEESLTA